MKQSLSLDAVRLFLAVAETGGLAGAARATGVSVATLSRKMTELERQAGVRLFERGRARLCAERAGAGVFGCCGRFAGGGAATG